ncbi:hypothetical protein BDR07DRAFT_1613490 [Suillus spraguei]|nr:hypothetical protein BDR07DRAFT_1613490 [Suillus spraguei]
MNILTFSTTTSAAPGSHPPPAPAPPTALPSATTSTTFKAQLQHLLTWWPDHAAQPVVDVPFAQGKERNAAVDAPKQNDDCVPDEYCDDHPPDADTQQQSTVVQADIGEHGGRCCCC